MSGQSSRLALILGWARQPLIAAALVFIVASALYWGWLASDRYVSEGIVVVQRTDTGSVQGLELSNILGGSGNINAADQRLLRLHLLSVDMMIKLDERFDLRRHYSDNRRDILSRMSARDIDIERFHEYYMSRVAVDYDEHSGVLSVKVQAYDAQTAHDIAFALVEEGERFMNDMAHRLAREQVAFLQVQVAETHDKLMRARTALLAFQNEAGLASPQDTAESISGIVHELESQLAELQAKRGAMLGYLVESSSNIVELDHKIRALEQQIAVQQRRLAAPRGSGLNEAVEQYQRLQLEADFAHDLYKSSLIALEQGRVEATRLMKKVSILQSPTMPQYPLAPRRLYNLVLTLLGVMLFVGIVQLLGAIVRDHKD
jgi:capsular polysaccharide transport system permease protein